jgi:hypothetical protein
MSQLPRKEADELKGELMKNTFERLFSAQPREAIDFLALEALKRCKFFPTPAECNAILEEWKRSDPAFRLKERAKLIVRRERQARFDDTNQALKLGQLSQEQIDALSDWQKAVALGLGYLQQLEDGSLVARPDTRWIKFIEEQEQLANAQHGERAIARAREAGQ